MDEIILVLTCQPSFIFIYELLRKAHHHVLKSPSLAEVLLASIRHQVTFCQTKL